MIGYTVYPFDERYYLWRVGEQQPDQLQAVAWFWNADQATEFLRWLWAIMEAEPAKPAKEGGEHGAGVS